MGLRSVRWGWLLFGAVVGSLVGVSMAWAEGTVDLATPFAAMVNVTLGLIMQVIPYLLGGLGIILGIVALIALMKLVFRKL